MYNRILVFLSIVCALATPLTAIAIEEDDAKLIGLLADPNVEITGIEISPYRSPRYFIGGGAGFSTSDKNRLVNGYNGALSSTLILNARFGIDYSPRLTLKGEAHWYSYSDEAGANAYTIYSVSGGANINMLRSRGFVPYLKVMGGATFTTRDLSSQFSSTPTRITKGSDTSSLIDIGIGIMYDTPRTWLADGDVRLSFEMNTRRDNNDKATPVSYFQEGYTMLGAEYLFGSSVFFGQKIIVEREVTTDEGSGGAGLLREKNKPVLYPSAAELAALSDTSQPNIIFFNKYSSYVVDTQVEKLDNLVEQMEQNPNSQAIITGHADTNVFILDRVEQLKYNRAISAKRAVSVYNYFVSKGIDTERLQIQWRADQQLASRNKSAVAKSLNRRVQVLIR